MKEISKRNSRGQTLIEFTLLLPLILLLVGGLTDVGLAFFVSTSMENAVREGARLAASGFGGNIQLEVQNRIAAHGMFTSTPTVAVDGPKALGTTCKDQSGVNVAQQEWTVTATGTYNYMFLRLINIDSVQMSRSATMRDELTSICFSA